MVGESQDETYEIYAIRYATNQNRRSSRNFLKGDPHDVPMPIDYYVWAIVGKSNTYLVDTGFDKATALERGHDFLICPAEALKSIGIQATDVREVIISHLHFDHVGNFDKFPKARFRLQEKEMSYVTGRYMLHAELRRPFHLHHICGMIGCLYSGRVKFADGQQTIAPGITVHHVGGHTMGLQVVRVHTQRGYVVLASDAAHFYANIQKRSPHPSTLHVGDAMQAWTTIEDLATSPTHIIPGHDPLVSSMFPQAASELGPLCVRLDLDPLPEYRNLVLE